MKTNISFLDTILRIFIGATIGSVFGILGWGIGVIAVYPIVTGLIAWDPIYYKMGWYTTETSPYEEEEVVEAAPSVGTGKRVYQKTA